MNMRYNLPLLSALAMIGALATGCANVEDKFGRGMSNSYEIIRGGEMRRSVEDTMIFESPQAAYTTGVVRGFDRTIARTGIGIFEMVTAPLPPYHPLFTDYLSPGPVYPDSYTPRRLSDAGTSTDSQSGFDGGDVAPMIPGSRFHIFNGP
jgi:putative exosortase-associated protein (TIGR04073 family)